VALPRRRVAVPVASLLFLWRVCRKEAGLERLSVVVAASSTPGSFILREVEGLDSVRADKEEDGRTKAWRT